MKQWLTARHRQRFCSVVADAGSADGPAAIRANGLGVDFDDTTILRKLDVQVAPGELVALLGPNGAGKSTLIAALAGDRHPTRGTVALAGRDITRISPRALARIRTVLPQATSVSFPFTVREVVAMGRAPWAGTPAADDDEVIVEDALAQVDVADLHERRFPTLSGGEQARVALARALVQQTPILLLDEPTAALDLHHQQLVLRLARQRADAGDTVVVVLHDLALAAAHADRLVVLHGGRVVADGAPSEVMREDLLSEVYRHPIEVVSHPRTGKPLALARTDETLDPPATTPGSGSARR